jgi:mannose-6-phosphate isomerase-like protein (cupin superfamily)
MPPSRRSIAPAAGWPVSFLKSPQLSPALTTLLEIVMQKVNVQEKFSLFSDHWRPRIIAELNGQEVKVVKFRGEFVWHRHDDEDELFLAWRGRFAVEFRDTRVELSPGDLLVVPKGTEHRTVADEEVEVVLFEPAATRNTGNVFSRDLTSPSPDRI